MRNNGLDATPGRLADNEFSQEQDSPSPPTPDLFAVSPPTPVSRPDSPVSPPTPVSRPGSREQQEKQGSPTEYIFKEQGGGSRKKHKKRRRSTIRGGNLKKRGRKNTRKYK